jgi:acyl carrier protein
MKGVIMVYNDKIKVLVFQAIDEVNQQLLPEQQVVKSIKTPLLGSSAQLDSMGLVNLIIGLENILVQYFNQEIALVDENAFSLEKSPFQTVGTLIDYVSQLINGSAT